MIQNYISFKLFSNRLVKIYKIKYISRPTLRKNTQEQILPMKHLKLKHTSHAVVLWYISYKSYHIEISHLTQLNENTGISSPKGHLKLHT